MASITGLGALTARLAGIRSGLLPAAGEGLESGLSDMADGARRLCPVDTGKLRDSISGRKTGVASGELRAGMAYAAFVEMGTRSAPARPFMYPAFVSGKGAVVRGVASAISDMLR